jgi:hypothetical protein
MIEVGAKAALAHQVQEILVGGRHNAHVRTHRVRAPQLLEDVLLEEPQQLGLHLQGEVADFIEEQGPGVRELHAADRRRQRPRKGPSYMPEEVTFQQAAGNRRAVHGDEWGVSPPALPVNRPSNELLARPRLPLDQHGGVCAPPSPLPGGVRWKGGLAPTSVSSNLPSGC